MNILYRFHVFQTEYLILSLNTPSSPEDDSVHIHRETNIKAHEAESAVVQGVVIYCHVQSSP